MTKRGGVIHFPDAVPSKEAIGVRAYYRNALDRAAYALFQIKRMVGVPDHVSAFASEKHQEACKALDDDGYVGNVAGTVSETREKPEVYWGDAPIVDDLIDWIIDKNCSQQAMRGALLCAFDRGCTAHLENAAPQVPAMATSGSGAEADRTDQPASKSPSDGATGQPAGDRQTAVSATSARCYPAGAASSLPSAARRTSNKERPEWWDSDPHPHYGPCDGFINGSCSECVRVIFELRREVAEAQRLTQNIVSYDNEAIQRIASSLSSSVAPKVVWANPNEAPDDTRKGYAMGWNDCNNRWLQSAPSATRRTWEAEAAEYLRGSSLSIAGVDPEDIAKVQAYYVACFERRANEADSRGETR